MPTARTVFHVAVSTVFAILLLYVVLLVLKPKPITEMLAKNLNIGPNNHSLLDTDHETFVSPSTKIKGKIYHRNAHRLAEFGRILIDIPGGAFIRSSNTMTPYQNMEELAMPVVSISYPVLFDVSVDNGLQYVLDALQHIITSYSERLREAQPAGVLDVNILASSAGAYYAVLAINSNLFRPLISKVVFVSGYFGRELTGNKLFKMLHSVYLEPKLFRSAPHLKCYPIDPSVEVRLISTTNDFLLDATRNYAHISNLQPQIYMGAHSLFWTPSDPEAQRMYREITEFIMDWDLDASTLLKFKTLCQNSKEWTATVPALQQSCAQLLPASGSTSATAA